MRYTLLPEQFKKRVLAVYHIRLASAWCAFGIITVIVGIVAITPALINSQLQLMDVRDSGQSDKANNISNELKQIEKKVSNVSKLIKTLQDEMPAYVPSEVIHKIVVARNEGVTFSSFEISKLDDKSLSMSIQGKAATREALVSLKKKMAGITGVTKVELPITDLTKSKDIGFTVRLIANLTL